MSKIINLTPHELIVFKDNVFESEEYDYEMVMTIPSSGVVRVKEENVEIGKINGVPVYKKKYTESEGLPDPTPDTYYFVSILVAQANPDRKDLLLSSDLVRDENGRILGCKSFAQL